MSDRCPAHNREMSMTHGCLLCRKDAALARVKLLAKPASADAFLSPATSQYLTDLGAAVAALAALNAGLVDALSTAELRIAALQRDLGGLDENVRTVLHRRSRT